MTDPTTSNILLVVPTRGSDVGTWDIPVNGNSIDIDGFIGGVQVVSATNAPITLTSPAGVVTPAAGPTQSQNAVLRVTGALTANVQVTLPLPGYMIIENLTTGSFVLSFRAVGSGEVIGIEQGVVQRIYNDGTNVRFVNLPTVGSYMDVCDGTVPAWILACTKPPWLDCNGGTFNATTYPYLNTKLGGNTLPDFRGRSAFYLNEGTGRITSTGAGIDGTTRFASGGNNGLTAANLPSITSSGSTNVTSSNSLIVQANGGDVSSFSAGSGGGEVWQAWSTSVTITRVNVASSGTTSVTSNNTGAGSVTQNAAPGIISGLRLIRAA
jgi:hypothetical protein